MFDLNFHSQVKKILAWTDDAPGIHVMNDNEVRCQQKASKSTDKLSEQMIRNDSLSFRIYVLTTYSQYFDLEVKIGIMEKFPDQALTMRADQRVIYDDRIWHLYLEYLGLRDSPLQVN